MNNKRPKFAFVALLWTIQSFVGACQMNFSWNFQTTAIMFHPQDVAILLLFALIMHQGFSNKYVSLIIPWLSISFYVLYCYHLPGLAKLFRNLNATLSCASLAFFLHFCGFLLQMLIIAEISRMALILKSEE